jgi:hypothetical protein
MPLVFSIAPSHRIAHGTSRITTPLRSNQLSFMSIPSKTTHHPYAQASHIGAYLLGIAGSSMERQYFTIEDLLMVSAPNICSTES